MSNTNLKLALEIALQTRNVQEIDLLIEKLQATGVDISNLDEKSGHLNDTFTTIEKKQGLIELFRDQKLAVVDAANAWESAQADIKTLSDQWNDAKTTADELKTAIDAQGEATAEQNAAYKAAVKEAENLAKAHERTVANTGVLKDTHTQLNQSLNSTRQAMAGVGLSTTDLASQQDLLRLQSEVAEEALAELVGEAQNLSDIAQAKITLGIETDDAALEQIEKIKAAYETLRASGQLTSSELAAASEAATEQISELEAGLSSATDETTDFATELGKVTAAAGGLAVVTAAAMEFETAMAGVKKTVDGTPEQISALSNEIKTLSIDLGLSSEAVADIAAQGGQLGIPIEELGKFTEMAGKMSVAFGMSAEDAAESAAQLANVFGISMPAVEALSDAINTLGNNTAATEPDIINAMVRIGGTAKQFGLAEEQAASLAAAFIALGKPPEVAATAINGLLTKLQTAEVQGAGFTDTLDSIGLSADQLAADINANPQQALSDFLSTLGNLDEQQRAIATFKLFGQEYADDVNLLVGGLETYNTALGLTADKSATAGAMQSEFEAAMATSAAASARAEQALNVLMETLGQHLLPIVAATAGGIANIVGVINSLAETFPMVTKLVVLIAGAKVAMVAFNSTIALAGTLGLSAGASISTGMTRATTSIGRASTAANGLTGKMKGLGILFGAAAAWTIGTGIGDAAYQNSSAVRTIGDELGRVLAYADAIVTDRTFEDVAMHFETSAESTARLAAEAKNAVWSVDELAAAEAKATAETENQAAANRQLVNDIIVTEANIKIMEASLTSMAANGEKGTQAYSDLSNKLDDTKLSLEAMRLEANNANLGELLKTDLEKALGAFEALGLDAQEFATGLNSKTTAALDAFSTVAELAGNNTDQLARAYSAASDAAGTNAQAQAILEQKLLASVNGNQQLAASVKQTALEQQNAKLATDEQAAALTRLGINMDAANQKMSASGLEMVGTLKAGVAAIKEQATSAEALKTSLAQALDVSIGAAKTKADFAAISQTLKDAGVTSQATAAQMQLVRAGMDGGATAAAAAATAIEQQTAALTTNATAADQNSAASSNNASAKEAQAAAAEQAAESEEVATKAVAAGSVLVPTFIANTRNKISALSELGVTTEQVAAIQNKFNQDLESYGGSTFKRIAQNTHNLTVELDKQVKYFTDVKDAAAEMSQKLGSATVSSNDLARAQQTLRRATSASIDGIVDMDSQTLSNLQNAIDSARNRMQGLADDAKNTADSLEATLAKMQGRDDRAREIEQSKKLAELQEKINEAEARGNNEEQAQLQRALTLQKQINAEEAKKAKAQKLLQQQREQEQAAKEQAAIQRKKAETVSADATIKQPAPRPPPTPVPQSKPTVTPAAPTQSISADDVAASFQSRIEQAKAEARNEFATELIKSAKNRAI